MNGNKMLADTNIISYMLNGDEVIAQFLEGRDLYLSVITQIELQTAKHYSVQERKVLKELFSFINVIQTNENIAQQAINFRRTYNIKLTDAIIMATAFSLNIPFITADQNLYKVKEINIIQYDK